MATGGAAQDDPQDGLQGDPLISHTDSSLLSLSDYSSVSQIDFSLIPASKKFRMALLGITGSGKTSLVDLICNYADLNSCKIDSLQRYRIMEFEDESDVMESKTNVCVPYDVTIKGIQMEIIDTPGLQDSRGTARSQENIESIISKLKEGKYINCVCLVSNGRNPRFDLVTQQAISDILGILPSEVKNNTIILYTNTQSMTDINVEHKKIKSELGFTLKAFMLDNAYCGWTKIGQVDDDPDMDSSYDEEAEKQRLQEMLQKNFSKLDKIFHHIKSFKGISTDCFGYLRKVSSEIQLNYQKLQALEKTKASLEERIESVKQELQDSQKGVRVIKSQLDYIKTNVVYTPKEHNTICEADGCFSNCHAPCIFTGMLSRIVKNCRCFKDNVECNVCGHHYTYHAHQKFKYKEEEVQLRSSLLENLQEAETEEQQAEILLTEKTSQLVDLKYHESRIKLRSTIVILLAEIQRISSNADYEKIIDNELTRFSKYFDFLHIPKKDLTVQLALTNYREGLIEIQDDMPYGTEMSEDDKQNWARKILDIDPEKPLTTHSIHGALRQQSRKYMDIIKEGDDAIQKRHTLAKQILEQQISKIYDLL